MSIRKRMVFVLIAYFQVIKSQTVILRCDVVDAIESIILYCIVKEESQVDQL